LEEKLEADQLNHAAVLVVIEPPPLRNLLLIDQLISLSSIVDLHSSAGAKCIEERRGAIQDWGWWLVLADQCHFCAQMTFNTSLKHQA